MKRTAVFYGPVGGSTENVARRIVELIGQDLCDLHPVRDKNYKELEKYDNLIFGIATIGTETWHAKPAESGWFKFINELGKADLKGKVIALFGLGDHIRYPDHFVDAMGEIYNTLSDKGFDTIGKVKADKYEFNDSVAVLEGNFVGLPIDEVFQPDLTDARIMEWVEEIKKNFI